MAGDLRELRCPDEHADERCARDRKDAHLDHAGQAIEHSRQDADALAETHLQVLRHGHRARRAKSLNAESEDAEERNRDRHREDIDRDE